MPMSRCQDTEEERMKSDLRQLCAVISKQELMTEYVKTFMDYSVITYTEQI